MFGFLAAFTPYKWIAIGVAFASVIAWGGLEYVGKIRAQRELAVYQRQAVEVINARLIENAALQDRNQALAADVDASYTKGIAHAQAEFRPLFDELETLRLLWGAGARPRPAGLQLDGAGAVPGQSATAGGRGANACTDQPGRIGEAADRVLKDLEACRKQSEQLAACRAWSMSVRCSTQ